MSGRGSEEILAKCKQIREEKWDVFIIPGRGSVLCAAGDGSDSREATA